MIRMFRKPYHNFFFLLLMLLLHEQVFTQSLKKIYIANDEHTDYMWTGNEQQYDSVFLKMLDYYLAAIDSTKNNPPHLQARFNCDGTWWLRTYEKFRSPQEFEKLIAAIRSGHISCPMNMLVSTYGAQPAEAVIRGMMYAGTLSRKYNIAFPIAVSMENQTQPLGLSSLWAGSGAKYSWKGICGCASRISNNSLAKRNHQLYHYMGLDSSSVLMKWYSFANNNMSMGGYAELRHQSKSIDRVAEISKNINALDQLMADQSATSKYPYRVAGGFGYGWDDLDTYVSNEFINAARLNSNTERKVIVSNQQDFFEDIEKTYSDIPSETISYGNEWDTYCASMNETTARVRRAVGLLRTAESLTSVLKDKTFYYSPEITAARNTAFESLGLYWEHDWTADGPVTRDQRADWQEKIENNITTYSELLYQQSAANLANEISKGNGNVFYVFNPLGWIRSDYADIRYSGTDDFRIIDITTSEEIAAQKVIKNNNSFIRIWAKDIPAVGYRLFEIKKKVSKKLPGAAKFKNGTLQSSAYKIRITKSGAITSWIDLATKKELVKKVNNRYLNDAGFTLINEGEELIVENEGPVSTTVKAVSSHPFKHTTRITVFKNNRRIEIEDSILQNFRDLKTWAYSFNFNKPVTRHEELSAVLTAATASNGGHYADRNARYDWLTMNQFVNMSEGNQNITLSNIDCSFFKLGESRFDSLASSSSQINALAGGQTDKLEPDNPADTSYLGIYAQNGQTQFRFQFALTADAGNFNPTTAMQFALEHQHPFVTGFAKGTEPSSAPTAFSLLNISDPDLLLWSIKPAEDGPGQGLIVRVRNMSGNRKNPLIKLNNPIQSAWQVTHIENTIGGLPVQHTTVQPAIKGLQMISLKIIPANN
jgi:alpha-mannosidase